MKVNFGQIIGCDINLSQKITSKTMAASDFTATEITDLQNTITNDMQAAATAALENNTEMGSELGGVLDGGDTNMSIVNSVNMEIKNLVETNITTTNVNNTVAEQVNIQDGELNLKYYDCSDGNAKASTLAKISCRRSRLRLLMNILKQSIASSKMLK